MQKQHLDGEKGLMVRRYENGKIAEISEYVYLQDYHDSPDDARSQPVCHLVGAYLSFYKSGKLQTVAVSGQPTVKQPPYPELEFQRIYEDSPIWSKTFNSRGELIREFGNQGQLKIPMEMLTLLKKEGILPTVQQFLTKKAPAKSSKFISLKKGRC